MDGKQISPSLTEERKNSEASFSYEVITQTDALVADLEAAIHQATHSVKMQFLSYEADAIGYRIADALFAASRRGVQVQLLVDYYTDLYHRGHFIYFPHRGRRGQPGLWQALRTTRLLFDAMRKQDIQVRRTNPLGFLYHRSLWRDHKKLVVVDHAIPERCMAYVGCFNVAEHHARWHDFMVKMHGPVVSYVDEDFERTWTGCANAARYIDYGDGYLITDSPGRSLIFETALQAIAMANRRVILESPYVSGQAIQKALLEAVAKGVEVSLIVPRHNNHRVSVLSCRALKALAERHIHVYLYNQHYGMTHAKVLLVDDMAILGSANFSQFLAGKLAELSVCSHNGALIMQVERMLQEDMMNSIPLISPITHRRDH